jgi:hypothetical protein
MPVNISIFGKIPTAVLLSLLGRSRSLILPSKFALRTLACRIG